MCNRLYMQICSENIVNGTVNDFPKVHWIIFSSLCLNVKLPTIAMSQAYIVSYLKINFIKIVQKLLYLSAERDKDVT